MGYIFIIMGKSASGKDTIYKHLQEIPGLNLKTVITYTTRPIRVGETEGVEYHFVDEKRFHELKEQGKVIEHRTYHTIYGDWHYFTVNDGQINPEKEDYLLLGTPESFLKIREYYGKERVIPIYIEVDDGVRLMRALLREQSQKEPKYAEMCRRYLADEADFSEENLKKIGSFKRYNNFDKDECIEEIVKDIKKMKGLIQG